MATADRSIRSRWALALPLALGLVLAGCQSDEEKLAGFMERGTEYAENEEFEEAIIEYRNALQVDPNHAAAHEGLAEAYLRTRQLKEGYWELSETVRLDPNNIDARLSYATISLAAQRYDEVETQARAVIELEPENSAAHLLLGQGLTGLERYDEVEPHFVRAVELAPDDGTYRLVLAAFYTSTQQQRPDKAEEHLREGIARDPKPMLYTMLGQLAMQGGRLEESEQAFKDALATAEKLAAEAETEPVEVLQGYQNLASFYFQNERAEEGVAALQAGIENSARKPELVALLARYYRSQGQDDEADRLIEESTKIDPSDPVPFLTVSNLRGRKGDLEGALEAADQAIAASPTHVQSRLRKAELLIDIGTRQGDQAQVDAGRALVDEVLAENPSSPDGLFVLAKFEIAKENVDAGIEALRTALDGRPNWPQAHFVLGSALLLKGEAQRARAELARAVELEPGLLEARRLLTQIHAQLGEHEYAIENGQRYLASRPEDAQTRIIVAQSMVRLGKVDDAIEMVESIPEEQRTVDVLFALGRLQVAKGRGTEARATMLAANEMRPNNARILNVLLALDRADGKLSHSIKRVNDAVEASPEDADLWHLKGQVAALGGDTVAAETALRKAIELDPSHLESYQTLARIYAATGRSNETIALYEKAVESQPDNAGAHHFLGVLYEMTGQTDKAKKQYELALQYDPSLGESKNNLAYLMAESGDDLDTALKLAQEAKAAMPDSPNAADTLGWVLYKRGVASAAIGYLREAVQVANPDDPLIGEIRTHLSLAYEAAGEVDKAIETLETALADLERLKENGTLRGDPPWAADARSNIERLRSAG